MRAPASWLLITCLLVGVPALVPFPPLVGVALAQAIAKGDGARILGTRDTRVNVRSEPRVQAGNIVATARGGDLLRVRETADEGRYTWYRVATLPGESPSYAGWVRGDLLVAAPVPEPTLSEVLATPVPEPTLSEVLATPVPDANPPEKAPAAESVPAPVPLAQRTDWSRDLIRLFPAIKGCAAVGSAPPITVLRAIARSRGLAEIIMSDAAGRRWDCVIRDTGGTPIRYDPLSGAVYMRDRMGNEPFFSVGPERPALDPSCFRFEEVADPKGGESLGWLYYRTCS